MARAVFLMEADVLRRDIRCFANPLVSRSESEQQHCRRIAFAMDERAHANLFSLMTISDPCIAVFQCDGWGAFGMRRQTKRDSKCSQ